MKKKLTREDISEIKQYYKAVAKAYGLSIGLEKGSPSVSSSIDVNSDGDFAFFWKTKEHHGTQKGNVGDFPERMVCDGIDFMEYLLLPVTEADISEQEKIVQLRKRVLISTKELLEKKYFKID